MERFYIEILFLAFLGHKTKGQARRQGASTQCQDPVVPARSEEERFEAPTPAPTPSLPAPFHPGWVCHTLLIHLPVTGIEVVSGSGSCKLLRRLLSKPSLGRMLLFLLGKHLGVSGMAGSYGRYILNF